MQTFCALLVTISLISAYEEQGQHQRGDFSRGLGPYHGYHGPYHHHHHGYGETDEYQDRNKQQHGEFVVTVSNVKTGGVNDHLLSNLNASKQVPIDFFKDVTTYNISDLLLNYVEVDESITSPFVSFSNRFGEDDDNNNSERRKSQMAKPANCMPELTTVELIQSNDPSIVYIPQCTRVERCGGCCTHNLLSCQPTESESLSFQVLKTQYTGAKKLKYLSKEIIVVEKHTKCKCDCKLKAEDCNQYQRYKKNECACVCTNMDEEKKCKKDGFKKLWNPEVCACQCREVMQCSTGTYFDSRDCRCLPVPMKRRFADYESNKNETSDVTL